jgi:hypothetical protein
VKKNLLTCFLFFALGCSSHAFSQSGNVLNLDGVNAYMSVADHADLDIAPGQTKTITCWIKTTSVATSRLLAKRGNANTLDPSAPGLNGTGYEVFMGNGANAGKIGGNASAWDNTAATSQPFSTTSYSSSSTNDGIWHHLAVVFDNASANKTVTFYVDGANPVVRAGTFSNDYDFSTAVSFVIGAAANATNFFGGQIDDVRVWNVAMSQAQVQAEMTTIVNGPATNLLAAWDFENVVAPTVPDISGNNHPGTLNGNAKIVSGSLTNKILALDGTAGTYMSAIDHEDLDINSGESYTISCKIKTSTTIANPRILAKRTGTTGTAAGYEFISSGIGQFGANLRSVPVSAGPAFSTATINNNQWHHIAMVVDQAAGNSRIYVDGVLDKTSSTWATPQDFSNAVNLYVGADATASHGNRWTGQIDDIRIWNKAMTALEVVADGNTVISGATANLMACWDFEGTGGNMVPDVSGNNHPGTLNGNAVVLTVSNTMTYQATTLTQTELPVGKGDADQRIIAVNVTTTGSINPISLTSLRFSMNGTSNLADISNVKIYYTGASNRFATTTQFASATPQAGTITVNGSQTLGSGNNYFWIAYDVTAGATENNVLDATCEGITVDGTAYNFSSPNNTAAGSRPIFLTHTLVFSGGDYGSANYRIPAIVTAADGSLVTVTDKRWNHAGDLRATIDPVVRRSTDNGKTWSAPVTIANFGGPNGAGDAALVLDKLKNPGTILSVFAAEQGFGASTPANPIRIQYSKSTDNGISWTAPADITDQVYGAGCSDPVRQAWYGAFLASGQMHQLRNGRIVGVLAVRQTSGTAIDNFMLYSDDGGTTWSVSPGIAAAGQADEAKIVQLNNGNLMVSTRRAGARRISISTDGGMTWGLATVQNQLVEPGCNGDFIRYSSTLDGAPQNVLLHSIPNHSSTRRNVSVFVSKDEGANWSLLKTIYPQASAYSGLTVLSDGTVGVYYECGEYETYQMYFARFSAPQLLFPMPVKLTEFAAACTGEVVQLSWQTAQEINADFYEVQASTDGTTWNKAGTVVAKGNSNEPLQYTYRDAPQQGKFYRLKMVDRDGTFAFSKVVVADCSSKTWSAAVYPNPTKGNVELTWRGQQKMNVPIEMTNTQGQRVWQGQLNISMANGKASLPFQQLPNGLYYLKINAGGEQQIIPVVKQ